MKKNDKSIPNVPALRFEEFSDEWDVLLVSDLLETFSTNSLSWDMLDYDSGEIYNLHYGLIHSGLPTQINVAKNKLPKIKTEFVPKNYSLCEDGDIAFADASEDTEEVGKVVEFADCKNDPIVCGLHTIHCRDKLNKTVVGYKGYAFSSTSFHHQIRRIAQGAKIISINMKNFSEVYIGVPSAEEQRKIAYLLTSIDERIEVQNKIISKYETLIKGISRDYFSKTPYGSIKIKDLIVKGKAGGTPSSTIMEYYDGSIPFLSISDMTKQGKYIDYTEKHISESGLNNSSAWIVPENSLIFSMYASVGLVCINKVSLATSQALFSMILKDSNDLDYIYFYLNYFRENKIHKLLETGTQSNINADAVLAIVIPIYDTKLTYVKSMLAFEKRLNNEKDTLFRLTDLKAYLLSKLFI